MANRPTRDQLIDKLRGMELELTARTRPFADEEPHDSRGVIHWTVNGSITVWDDDAEDWADAAMSLSDPEREPDGGSRLWVFWMTGMSIDLDAVGNAWHVLDSRDMDSEHLMPLVDYATGQIAAGTDEYDEAAEGAGSLVLIDRAQVAPGWRGHGGLGRLMIQRAIDLVADPAGLSLVALEAHPYLEEASGQSASPESIAATERIWESMGFTRVGTSKLFIHSTGWTTPFDDTSRFFAAA